jgi:hypothetical protein
MARAPTDIRSLARAHTEIAIKVLAGIAKDGTNEGARVSAAQALLDRGWGKAPQSHTGEDGEGEITIVIRRLAEEDAMKTVEGRVVKTIDQDVKAILGTASGAEEE